MRIRARSCLRDGIVHLVEGVEILHIVLGHLLKVYVPGFNLLIKGLSVVGLAFHLLEDVAELFGCVAGQELRRASQFDAPVIYANAWRSGPSLAKVCGFFGLVNPSYAFVESFLGCSIIISVIGCIAASIHWLGNNIIRRRQPTSVGW